MIEPGESARLQGKPAKERLAVRAGAPRGFQGDGPAGHFMEGEKDFAHAAFPKPRFEKVRAEPAESARLAGVQGADGAERLALDGNRRVAATRARHRRIRRRHRRRSHSQEAPRTLQRYAS